MKSFNAPFFMNLSFVLPGKNDKEIQQNIKNLSMHLNYVAQRPGVALEQSVPSNVTLPMDQQLHGNAEELISEYSAAMESGDYFRQSRLAREMAQQGIALPGDDEEAAPNPTTNKFFEDLDSNEDLHRYVKYAHERPNSHGLFGSGDDEINLKDIVDEVAHHKGIVWKLLLSLEGQDASRLDMDHRSAWESMLKTTMANVIEEMGIAEANLNWVGAFHEEKGHPHVHLVFWEKKPKRRMGKVTNHVREQMRKRFIKQIYREERDQLGKDKTAMRDAMRKESIKGLRDAVNFAREWNLQKSWVDRMFALSGRKMQHLVSNPDMKQVKLLKQKLEHLSPLLPGKGRLMLKFMPDNVKAEVRKITEWLYEQPQFAPLRQEYERTAREYASNYNATKENVEEAVTRAKEDIYNRMGQMVLRASLEIDKKFHFEVKADMANHVIDQFSKAKGYIKDDQPLRIAKKFLKLIHDSGLPRSTLETIFERLNLPSEFRNEIDIQKTFKNPSKQLPVPKELILLLRNCLGEIETKTLLASLKNGNENVKLMESLDPKDFSSFKTDWISLGKSFGVTNVPRATAMRMLRVLVACGVDFQSAGQLVFNWSVNSGTNVTEPVIKGMLKGVMKDFKDRQEWGNTIGIDERQYQRLCQALQIHAPYPFRSAIEVRSARRGHYNSVSTNLFKSALSGLEGNMRRMEAEKEFALLLTVNRIKQDAERDQEKRERGGR